PFEATQEKVQAYLQGPPPFRLVLRRKLGGVAIQTGFNTFIEASLDWSCNILSAQINEENPIGIKSREFEMENRVSGKNLRNLIETMNTFKPKVLSLAQIYGRSCYASNSAMNLEEIERIVSTARTAVGVMDSGFRYNGPLDYLLFGSESDRSKGHIGVNE